MGLGVDFNRVPVTCYSSLGTPYLRWVAVGVPKINQTLIDSTFFLYKDEADARSGGAAQGTGFVVCHQVHRFPEHSNRLTFTHYYAVTNAHVARIAPVVRINKKKTAEVFEFDESEWDYHPDGDDIAIIHLAVEHNSLICCYYLTLKT